MRERRWESQSTLSYREFLAVGERLAMLGLNPVVPSNDVICYIEEWMVQSLEDFHRIESWPTEDVTVVRICKDWQGDFFLLAGGYHTVYQKYQQVGTYCSVSHPFHLPGKFQWHFPRAMFWVGFRDTIHSFIRIRLHTTDVITPGESRADDLRDVWLNERRRAFLSSIKRVGLPIDLDVKNRSLILRSLEPNVPFFCSWPDAFGPCQFEYNSTDVFRFLVPAAQLAATLEGDPAITRSYLTGFSHHAIKEFEKVQPHARSAFRCSVHCTLEDLPDILKAIAPTGCLYATLCEFQTRQFLPDAHDAWVIIGVVGAVGGFKLEARLNRAPLPEEEMSGWLNELLGHPVEYAPLPPFS